MGSSDRALNINPPECDFVAANLPLPGVGDAQQRRDDLWAHDLAAAQQHAADLGDCLIIELTHVNINKD